MSNPVRPDFGTNEDRDEASKGPNLVVLYSIIAFALVAAIVIAGAIVLPFYQRR